MQRENDTGVELKRLENNPADASERVEQRTTSRACSSEARAGREAWIAAATRPAMSDHAVDYVRSVGWRRVHGSTVGPSMRSLTPFDDQNGGRILSALDT